MSLFTSTPKPDDVFTPRSATINPDMYVRRNALEDMLVSALQGRLHIVVHGESGTGKSWLYKKVLSDQRATYMTANLANASRLGSISAEFKNLLEREGKSIKVGYEEEKATEISAGVASGSLAHTGQYTLGQKEPFEACLYALRERAGRNPAVLVLDNLEAAFNDALLTELANLLILCDDERYACHRVHIIVVGVPAQLKEYYYKTPNHRSIANRLYELPEVSRLSTEDAHSLLTRGLFDILKYDVDDKESILKHISWITDRVPQMLQEYGLILAKLAEGGGRRITFDLIATADQQWMFQSLNQPYAVIELHMNERDTKAGRRNQTLVALGLMDGEQFKATDIEKRVRRSFPVSTDGTALNLPQMLASFAGGDRPLIKRSPKGDAFHFVDPRYRMVLRAMLVVKEEKVLKRPIYR